MIPPDELNVLDRHGGFTAESKMPYGLKGLSRMDFKARRDASTGARLYIGDTLWRPGRLLKRDTVGDLLDYDERSFYQRNDDVTIAVYRVPGYSYPVLAWFDNASGERIA